MLTSWEASKCLSSEILMEAAFLAVQSLSRVWLCNPMYCRTPGSPVLPHLPEFAQTHVLWVDDAIQLSNPLLPPSLAFTLFQHHGLFQWVGSLHQVAELLELQRQSFQWILRWLPLGLTGLISLLSKGLSTVFSNTQFKSTNSSMFSLFNGPAFTSVCDYWKSYSLN